MFLFSLPEKNSEPATGAGGPGSNQCTPKKNGDMRIAHGFAQQSADKSPQFQGISKDIPFFFAKFLKYTTEFKNQII